MKYLKLYESVEDRFNLFKDFCKDSLSYLLDDGYVLQINKINTPKSVRMMGSTFGVQSVNFRLFHKNRNFSWSEIESDFLPFLELLDGKYLISKWYGSEGEGEISVESPSSVEQFNVGKLLNEKTFINNKIIEINIKVNI